MARRKKRGFIQIYWDFYDSKEWRSLHWYSKLAYLRMKRKYNPRHTEEITVSYREMSDEMSQPTFAKAVKELVRVGFIDYIQKGGLYRKRNFYSFAYRWKMPKINQGYLVDIHKAKQDLASKVAKIA